MHRAGLDHCLGPGGPGVASARPAGRRPRTGNSRPVHRPGPRPHPGTCSDTTACPHPTTHVRGPVRHVRAVPDLDHQRTQEGSPGRTPPNARDCHPVTTTFSATASVTLLIVSPDNSVPTVATK